MKNWLNDQLSSNGIVLDKQGAVLASFEEIWKKVAIPKNGEPVSPALYPLLKQFYDQMARKPNSLQGIKSSLENLLSFLTTVQGRTTANCFAVDLFVDLADWDLDWDSFPEQLKEIISDMVGVLRYTVRHPEVAANFYGLPEQLLDRVRRLNIQ